MAMGNGHWACPSSGSPRRLEGRGGSVWEPLSLFKSEMTYGLNHGHGCLNGRTLLIDGTGEQRPVGGVHGVERGLRR